MVLSVQESFAYGAFGPLLLDAEEDEDSEEASEEEFEILNRLSPEVPCELVDTPAT